MYNITIFITRVIITARERFLRRYHIIPEFMAFGVPQMVGTYDHVCRCKYHHLNYYHYITFAHSNPRSTLIVVRQSVRFPRSTK